MASGICRMSSGLFVKMGTSEIAITYFILVLVGEAGILDTDQFRPVDISRSEVARVVYDT